MQILSINRAMPIPVEIEGQQVLTGINKQSTHHPIVVKRLGLEGDDQADKRFHGGVDQAVYCYSAKHYAHWQQYLSVPHLPYGTLGENLTLSEFDEKSLCIGDILQVGHVQLQITKPRIPCFKLAHKLNDKSVVKAFLQSGFTGAYCRVLQEGEVEPNQSVELVKRDLQGVSIKTALILQKLDLTLLDHPVEWFDKALAIESLTAELQSDFEKRRSSISL